MPPGVKEREQQDEPREMGFQFLEKGIIPSVRRHRLQYDDYQCLLSTS